MSAASVQRAVAGMEAVVHAAVRRGERIVRVDVSQAPLEARRRLLARFGNGVSHHLTVISTELWELQLLPTSGDHVGPPDERHPGQEARR